VFLARAIDGEGNARDAEVGVTVDNTAPFAVILEPADGSVLRGTIPFSARIFDATSGVVSVRMRAGGEPPTGDASIDYASPYMGPSSDRRSATEDTTRWPDGPLALEVTVWDAAGNQKTATVQVLVDNSRPESLYLSPANGATVSRWIEILAGASEADLERLVISVDGRPVGESTVSPLSVRFDTLTRLDGPMRVEATATDRAGNTSTRTAHLWRTSPSACIRATSASRGMATGRSSASSKARTCH
jgi:hypothetical protein